MIADWPKGESAVRFVLPLPPSVNEIWVGRGMRKGYARSAKYKAWAADAGWEVTMRLLKSMRSPCIKPAAVLIEAGFSHKRDIDNGVKATLDLMTKLGVIDDDRWVEKLLVERVPGDKLTVSVWKI